MRERVRVVRGSDVFLGLDISKASWHVTARSGGETLLSASFPPKREALKGLLQGLEGCQVHSAYETGPFGYGLHDWLRSHQVDSIVVSAAHVPGEIGNRVKTDRRDGLKLARTLEAGLLRPTSFRKRVSGQTASWCVSVSGCKGIAARRWCASSPSF
jgi:transposase